MRRFHEVNIGDLRQLINALPAAKISLTEEQVFNQTIWRDKEGTPLLRMYQHKRSQQCLMHHSISEHLPRSRVEFLATKEGSLYV